jgi:hypothetical protein
MAMSKKKAVPVKKDTAKSTEASPSKREFAKFVWPRIKESTTFVDVPETQGTVSYARPSGEQVTATLKWYTVSHGPRILGHYDEETDVCYIGQFFQR